LERDTERELARQMIAGERGAFDGFVEYFRPKIFQYSWLMCGHREDARLSAIERIVSTIERGGSGPDAARLAVRELALGVGREW